MQQTTPDSAVPDGSPQSKRHDHMQPTNELHVVYGAGGGAGKAIVARTRRSRPACEGRQSIGRRRCPRCR